MAALATLAIALVLIDLFVLRPWEERSRERDLRARADAQVAETAKRFGTYNAWRSQSMHYSADFDREWRGRTIMALTEISDIEVIDQDRYKLTLLPAISESIWGDVVFELTCVTAQTNYVTSESRYSEYLVVALIDRVARDRSSEDHRLVAHGSCRMITEHAFPLPDLH